MTEPIHETAQHAAERLAVPGPWELFGQRLSRFELYADGLRTETVRGPLLIEGVGLRLFRPSPEGLGVGFQATTDLSEPGLRQLIEDAETTARHARFPTPRVTLPTGAPRRPGGPRVEDPKLSGAPVETVREYLEAVLSECSRASDVAPSFGSVRATIAETTLVNSEGLSVGYRETFAELELALKSVGTSRHDAAGEYWITRALRRLDRSTLTVDGPQWTTLARDVRRATATPGGPLPVALPASLLSEIVPSAIRLRFSGAGRLRKMAIPDGTPVAAAPVTLVRDPTVDWSVGSAPVDDEGAVPARLALVSGGKLEHLLYDALHASAFDLPTNAAAGRAPDLAPSWRRFQGRPHPTTGTLAIEPGPDGTDEELLEAIVDGVWIDQLGWPNPDGMSGSFGGEIRIGYRIRHGRLAEPIRGGTLGGLVFSASGEPSLLGSVRKLGSTARLEGSLVAPTLVTDGLTLSGPT